MKMKAPKWFQVIYAQTRNYAPTPVQHASDSSPSRRSGVLNTQPRVTRTSQAHSTSCQTAAARSFQHKSPSMQKRSGGVYHASRDGLFRAVRLIRAKGANAQSVPTCLHALLVHGMGLPPWVQQQKILGSVFNKLSTKGLCASFLEDACEGPKHTENLQVVPQN